MTYWAHIDNENTVVNVSVGNSETEDKGLSWLVENIGGTFIETWIDEVDVVNERKNLAGIGYTYDQERNAFIAPKPFGSWTLNEEICQWESPTPNPADGNLYAWNESTISWDLVE
jgi:hypothetical protein